MRADDAHSTEDFIRLLKETNEQLEANTGELDAMKAGRTIYYRTVDLHEPVHACTQKDKHASVGIALYDCLIGTYTYMYTFGWDDYGLQSTILFQGYNMSYAHTKC